MTPFARYLLLLVGFALPASAQTPAQTAGADRTYGGARVEAGIATSTVTTYWYWYESRAGRGHNPIHVLTRQEVWGALELRSLLQLGGVHLNARTELRAGLGPAREDWLPQGETISEGGTAFGLALIAKLAYPLARRAVVPYVGVGAQFTYLTANGEGVGDQFAGRSTYNYTDGWGTGVTTVVIPAGVALGLGRFVVTPEVRVALAGTAFTDWEPGGNVPSADGVEVFTLSLGVGLR